MALHDADLLATASAAGLDRPKSAGGEWRGDAGEAPTHMFRLLHCCQETETMPIIDVMRPRLVAVAPDATVQRAVALMLDEEVGAVVVCEDARLVGIFTERDVLRLAGRGADLASLRVDEVMTTRVVTVSPEDDILAVARVMGDRRIRHVPVLQGEHVVGLVGIRDVVDVLAERLWRDHDDAARDTVHGLLARPPRTAAHT
jgi:CBS domain-containing protein